MCQSEGKEAKHGYVKNLERHVKTLTDGGRGNLIAISDALVSLCEAMMFIMQVDYVTTEALERKHSIQWRVIFKDVVIGLGSVTALCFTLLKILGK